MNNKGRITRRMIFMMLMGLTCQYSLSQQVSITSATKQGWAGGVCCVHGVDYTVNVKVILNKYPVTFDTLWIEGYCHDLARYNSKTLQQKDTLDIQFSEGISINDHQPYMVNPQREVPPLCYNTTKKGVMLQYRVNGIIYSLDVTPYLKELMFIAYP